MCGICGIVYFDHSRRVDPSCLKTMTDQLAHRGPDDSGTWVKGHLGLGHRRLAIIDLTRAGHQPLSNGSGDVWITYNGEVYNFNEIREKLEDRGHRFSSRTDTEVVLHLYEEDGYGCVDRLRGMFAFAIWDEKRNTLFVARDRLGQKPFYYYLDDEKIVFASEIKSIFASNLVPKEIDHEAVYQYLHLGYVPHPKTGYKGINKLPPGHQIVLSENKLELEQYYHPGKNCHTRLNLDDHALKERIVAELNEATKIRMIADVPVGLLLSGGIDSAAVAALASSMNGGLKTFTVGFENEFYDERKEARALANTIGSDHHELVIKPDMDDILPRIARAYDEPFADPSAIASYCISELASQHVKVVLNGDGGDEAFAGYGEYVQGIVGSGLVNVPASVCSLIPEKVLSKFVGKIKSLSQVIALGGNPIEHIFAHLRLSIPFANLNSALNPDFLALVKNLNPIDHLINCYRDMDHNDTVNTMLAVDQKTFLPDDLLFKIDIATMRHGLEARSPFLDHCFLEFVNRIPGSLKMKWLKKKYILKQAMGEMLPAELLKRPKRGFDAPVSSWLKGRFKGLCQDIIESNQLIPQIFKKDHLQKMFTEHVNGVNDYGRFFWKIIMLHFWSQEFHTEDNDAR